MKIFLFKLFKKVKLKTRGFILPLTLLVCLIMLIISSGISTILSKEIYFSKISRESQIAYYSADNAMMCTLMIDDKYVDPTTGLGIFPYDGLSTNSMVDVQNVIDNLNINRQDRGFNPINVGDIKCASTPIFDATLSSFRTAPRTRINSSGVVENGIESSFSMKMDLGDGSFRCAKVFVFKTSGYRQIIARGFSSCSDRSSHLIERAVVNTTESQ